MLTMTESCIWLKSSPSLQKGVVVINGLEDSKFEQFLRRVVSKSILGDTEIFTTGEKQKLEKLFKVNEEALMIAIKTIGYLFKRLLKYIFMPINLHKDLINLGFTDDKAECIVKVWSSEAKSTLKEFRPNAKYDEEKHSLEFTWKLNAELSSECRKKCKVPKAYLSLEGKNNCTELEMTHRELHSMFIQLEAIQNELDSFI